VPDPILVASMSPAALSRAIDAFKPTVLIDEIDKLLAGNKDLVAAIMPIVNSGYKKSGFRIVVEDSKKEGKKVRKMPTFCAKMLAGISNLPPDTASRCIPIWMERMLPGDRVAEIDEYIIEPEAQKLYGRAQRWARQNLKQLRDARPDAPSELGHRQREISRPLFAICDVVGGAWPDRIRAGVVRIFAARNAAPSDDIKIELLGDIRQAFDGCDRMSSANAYPEQWVFENPDRGKPWSPNNIQWRWFRPAGLKVTGEDRIGWHNFRHTFSTMLRELGTDVKVQQELLRHADVRTTLQIYTQADLQQKRDAMGKLTRRVLRRA